MTNQQNQPEISDNIIRKLQLLLKLGERKEGNETEAAAAMAKAQDLLAQYNLDLATVQDKVVAGGTNTPEDEMAKRDYARVSRSAMYNWQRELVRTLAETNYCKYWVEETTEFRWKRDCKVKRHKVLGRTINTTAVLVMTDYLMATIERLLPYKGKERLSRSAVSWREGCADRLIERIVDKARKMKEADYATQGEAAFSTAIAVRNMASAEEIGNYDFLNGKGAWAAREARKAENEKYWAAIAEQEKKEREAREQKELDELTAKLLLETPEQKARREAKEIRDRIKEHRRQEAYSARYWARQDRADERASRKRDHSAYAAGSTTAEKIGLDSQLKQGKSTDRLN